MTIWKLPPRAKIYEALSAIADARVTTLGGNVAEVVSSGGDKTYRVEWSDDLTGITSNDNASYWQGYMGYPILAVLMMLGKLKFNKETARRLAGIHWKEINKKFKRDYNKAVDFVLSELESKGISRKGIESEVDQIWTQLEAIRLDRLPRRRRPPAKQA
jgi:hypothetical protein